MKEEGTVNPNYGTSTEGLLQFLLGQGNKAYSQPEQPTSCTGYKVQASDRGHNQDSPR